jgi:hypothetical protein
MTGLGINKLNVSGWWWFVWVPLLLFQGFIFQAARDSFQKFMLEE